MEALMAAMLFSAITNSDGCGIDAKLNGYEYETESRNYVSGTLQVDPNDRSCAKIEADIADKQADTQYQKIVNFERVLRICEKQDLPELCGRLDDMSARIDIE